MKQISVLMICFVFFMGGLGGSVSAATAVSSCTTITSPGVYELTSELTSTSTCITIRSSDVIFDGAGYSITGQGSKYGIYVYNSSDGLTNVTIKHVTVMGWKYGIFYRSAENGSITGNTALNNNQGIRLYSSSGNTIVNNTASSNSEYGIVLWSSSKYNTITNNYFNNTDNYKITTSSGNNIWSVPKKAGANIIGGTYLGGNFWAKPDGTGFSETCGDTDGDGICDSSYTLASGNIDYLPLTITAGGPTTTTTTTTTTLTSTTTTLCDTKDCDPTQIPEFPTVAVPAILALGGYLVMRRRKRG